MGKISFANTNINYSNPQFPSLGYSQGKIQRNMSDLIDESTGQPWKIFNSNPPNHLKIKKAKNVFWPSVYDTERINEEMAYALDIMNPKTKTLISVDNFGKKTYVYSSFASDGQPIEIMYQENKLVSIYPKYF